MSWNYDLTSIATSQIYQVRYLTGDVDETQTITLADEEIAYEITLGGNIYRIASNCAFALAAKAARLVDKAVGALQLSASQKHKAFLETAMRLRSRAQMVSATAFAGGISVFDKGTRENNEDRITPAFGRGMESEMPRELMHSGGTD